MKLSKIPVPRCYSDVKYDNEELYEEDLEIFRGKLPEFSEWTDSQVIDFGNDYARVALNMSAFQDAAILPEQMRDVAMAMVILDITMDDLGKYADEIDWYEENGAYGIWNILNGTTSKKIP